jgi:hypothetical protein
LNAKLSSTPPGASGQFIYNNAGAFGAKALANSDLPASIDFTTKTVTAPVKAGTSAPGTCVVSELFFDTDATAGLNMFGCTATDTWTLLGDGGSGGDLADPGGNGVVVRTSSGVTTNRTITAGTGIAMANGDGVSGNPTVSINTAEMSTTATLQSGAPFICQSASGSGANYTCSMSPALGVYTEGMVIWWTPDVSCAGGATQINVNSIGNVNVKAADGTTNPTAAQCVAGRQEPIWYDGTVFRLPPGSSGGGISNVVEDTTPQLGGDLDANSFKITGGTIITGQTAKTTPIGADSILLSDSAASGALKKVTLDELFDSFSKDPARVYRHDEFLSGARETFYNGSLGWDYDGSSSPSIIAAVAGRPGVLRLTTTTADDNVIRFIQGGSEPGIHQTDLTGYVGWWHRFRVRPNSTAARYNIGLLGGGFAFDRGVSLSYDSDTDTNWQCTYDEGVAATVFVDSGVAYSAASWIVVDVYSDTLGGVRVAINGTACANRTTSLPDSGVQAAVRAQTRVSGTAATIDIDSYSSILVVNR